MRPLKIALLCAEYWEESHVHYDGEGGSIRQLAETVAALGHEIIVLSQSPEVRKVKRVPVGVLETWVSPLELHRDLITGIRDRWARAAYSHPKVHSDALVLREFLARRGPFDILWVQSETPDGLVAAMTARLGVKLPPILLHARSLRCRFDKTGPVFTEKGPIGLAFRQATRILAYSEFAVNAITRYAGRGLTAADLKGKVHIVPPNLQRAFLRAAREVPSFPAPMPDRVLFLGEINQRKGSDVFLKALPRTETSKRISTFAVAGDFTEYNWRYFRHWEEAQEATRVQLSGARMEYLGRISTYEVIRQIQLSRVVVIPSLFDPFGRGVVESLVLGRPVITTDQVGSSGLLKAHSCGIVIAPNDPAALAQAIDVVLSPIVPFAEKAKYAGRPMLDEFSPETIALKIERHFSEIVR